MLQVIINDQNEVRFVVLEYFALAKWKDAQLGTNALSRPIYVWEGLVFEEKLITKVFLLSLGLLDYLLSGN